MILVNNPDQWLSRFPKPGKDSHKYTRGHALIYGAPLLTGATRLAAAACARMGAGLVSVLCAFDTALIYRASLPAHILVRDDLSWDDERVTARLFGPGGLPYSIHLKEGQAAVIDADGLFALPEKLHKSVILTPHEREFQRMFPDLNGQRVENVQNAAKALGCIMVLKGAETILAHPDGHLVRNTHACAYLASAGTGDVLAGMITGLLAQGMEPFDAACAAVWMHGEAGLRFGPGLVASDIPDILPQVLRDIV